MKSIGARIWRDRDIAWLIAGVVAIGIFLGVALACTVTLISTAEAEDAQRECWIICQPGSEVLIREKAGKRAEIVGATCGGARMKTDGKQRNGYVHCIDMANESGEGWIYAGYVTFEEPVRLDLQGVIVGRGRVACRKCIGGKRKAWANPGDMVTVYWETGEWCVTNLGYIQAKYVEVP